MPRKYPYYPAWDGKQTQPITAKVVELFGKRWGVKNLGTYVNRPMRDSPDLSVHATGFACDLGGDIETLKKVWAWVIEHSAQTKLAEAHFYKAPGTKYGLGYRCSRGEKSKGIKTWTATDNGGSGGLWLHLEYEVQDVAAFEAYFRANKI